MCTNARIVPVTRTCMCLMIIALLPCCMLDHSICARFATPRTSKPRFCGSVVPSEELCLELLATPDYIDGRREARPVAPAVALVLALICVYI